MLTAGKIRLLLSERSILADMNPIEAMTFLKDRIEPTKNNEEFLMSMNS